MKVVKSRFEKNITYTKVIFEEKIIYTFTSDRSYFLESVVEKILKDNKKYNKRSLNIWESGLKMIPEELLNIEDGDLSSTSYTDIIKKCKKTKIYNKNIITALIK